MAELAVVGRSDCKLGSYKGKSFKILWNMRSKKIFLELDGIFGSKRIDIFAEAPTPNEVYPLVKLYLDNN